MKKLRSIAVQLCLLSMSFAVGCGVTLAALPNPLTSGKGTRAAISKLVTLADLVESDYIGEIDSDALINGAAYGYIAALGDKYSAYLVTEEYEESVASNEGEGVGIGITGISHPDTANVYVTEVYSGSPADVAGIRSGDQIEFIDEIVVKDMTFSDAIKCLHGESGTTVTVGILRDGEHIKKTVTRGAYTTQSVFPRMIGSVCYIKITGFNTSGVQQFSDAINFALNSKATAIVYDLRNNGGGTVASVGDMLDIILPEGDVMTVEYADGSTEVVERSDANEIDLPMAVLANGKTASAAELFTASIRDFNKGKIYGSVTYGKGVMQRTYPMEDGTAVRLTVGKFYPHGGVCFNEVGIEPDVEILPDEKEQSYYFLYGDENDSVLCAALKDLGVTEVQK